MGTWAWVPIITTILMAQGAIPYLGTFLTDLDMMHTVMKDYVDMSEFGLCGFGTRILRLQRREPFVLNP